MTKQAELLLAALAELLSPKKNYGTVKPRKPYVNARISKADVDDRTDRALQRRSSIAKGFARKGIKVTFVKETGRFENVKPYKVWLSEGFVVRRGEHGVKGLFHSTQCDPLPVVKPVNLVNPVIGMSV